MKATITNKVVFDLIIIVGVVILVLIAGYIGDQFALDKLTSIKVTPTQLADAMKSDDFYSTYRENTVVFSGQIENVSGNEATIKSSSSYTLKCQVDSSLVHNGKIYTFSSEAYRAERINGGVLLYDCLIV